MVGLSVMVGLNVGFVARLQRLAVCVCVHVCVCVCPFCPRISRPKGHGVADMHPLACGPGACFSTFVHMYAHLSVCMYVCACEC